MNEEYQRQVHLLYRYITYCFAFICLIFYGVGTCYASQHDMGYYSSHTDVYLSVPAANADIFLAQDTYNQAGMFDIIYVYIDSLTINSDYVYQMEMSTPAAHLTNANAAIAVQFVNNGVNQGCNVLGVDDINSGFPKIYFQCRSSFSNGTMIFSFYDINGTTTGLTSTPNNFKWGYTYMRYFDDATDIDWGPVTSNANANADRIITNDNSNTQNIINNQNQNTQDIINSNKVCSQENKNFTSSDITTSGYYLNGSGNSISNNSYAIIEYFPVISNSNYTLTFSNSPGNAPSYCLYDSEKVKLSCTAYNQNKVFTFSTTGASYISISVINNFTSSVNLSSETTCVNGNQALSDNINGLTGALTDSSSVDMDSLGNTAGWLPAGPIDSIINLPLNFLVTFTSALNGSCSPLHIPIPFLDNQYLDIPCLSTIFNQINGLSTFWSWVGRICSIMILYKYLIALYKYYDNLTSMKEASLDYGGAP